MRSAQNNGRFGGMRAGAMAVLAAAGVVLAGCATQPKDNANAKLMHFENTRAQRYTEIFAIYGDAVTKNLTAGVYNTIGLNGASPTGAGDSSPQALLDKVTPELVKKEAHAVGAFINGPRVWTLDWIEVNVGKERDFNGLKARWVTWFPIPKDMDLHKKGSTYYKPVQVQRHTKFGFNKGKPVFVLDAPNGRYVRDEVAQSRAGQDPDLRQPHQPWEQAETADGLEIPGCGAGQRSGPHPRQRCRMDRAG